ncbi:MAG: hypothetical protein GF309_00255 [Candidatus Lokiarchaeota archaeon]|nr:hypothetical protein [Candidatus Lokiarchaeota archaeon]
MMDGVSVNKVALVLLILGLLFLNDSDNPVSRSAALSKAERKSHSVSSYVEHASIVVENDCDFEKQGFEGNGTPKNPYLLQGLMTIPLPLIGKNRLLSICIISRISGILRGIQSSGMRGTGTPIHSKSSVCVH